MPPPPHADGRKILLFPRVLSKVSPEETSTSFSPFIFRDTGPDGSNLDLATSNNVMFVGHVEGYAYGASGHIVDVKRSGYMYAPSTAVINSQTVNNGSGSATLNTYNSSDGYLVFVCDLTFCLNLRIHFYT